MFVSLIVLTKGFQSYGQTVRALTLSQWVGQRFDSPGLAIGFAVLALLLVSFIVLILVGLTKVIAASLALPEIPVLVALVVFSFGYMMFGGANSMVYTNTVQASIMLLVAVLLIGSGYEHFAGGPAGFLERLRAIDPALAGIYNPDSPLFRDAFEVIFCTIVVGAAIACQPHIITKSLLLRDRRDVNVYLASGIVVQFVFFAVVIVGLYARLAAPDLMHDGRPIPLDNVTSHYLVTEFPWYAGVIVFLGLIAAGMSTLEGLIQSVSITITNDLVNGLVRRRSAEGLPGPYLLRLNRAVIAGLAALALALSWWQIVAPNLSVGIFAQVGVYAFFAAAFVPVLFGTFFRDAPRSAVGAAAAVAVVVHFGVYYTGQHWLPYYRGVAVRNPGIAAALAISAALVVGAALFLALRPRRA